MTNQNKYLVFGIELSPMAPTNTDARMYCIDLLDFEYDDVCMCVDTTNLDSMGVEYLAKYSDLMNTRLCANWQSHLNHKHKKIYYTVRDIEFRPDLYLVVRPDTRETYLFTCAKHMIDFLDQYRALRYQ